MTKAKERDTPGSTWNKTQDDEPVFILCGRDVLAPETAITWADTAESIGVKPAKVAAARDWAHGAALWQTTYGYKLPD